jgi:hypothetical protein
MMKKPLPDAQSIINRHRAEEEAKFAAAESKGAVQLSLWPETVRGIPNSALRGCLFAVAQWRDRKALQRVLIVDEKNLKIRYSGLRLDQSDLDVWEQALHMARMLPLGSKIQFSAHSFLKEMGRGVGKSQHEWLKFAISRLNSCSIEVTHEGRSYGGNLLTSYEREEATGGYEISINPKLARLYAAGWTGVRKEDRRKIGNKRPLALWLHGYFSSHAQIYPTKPETYRRLAGSETQCIRKFRQQLKAALTHLLEIGLIRSFSFGDDGLVRVEHIPTVSQQRLIKNL